MGSAPTKSLARLSRMSDADPAANQVRFQATSSADESAAVPMAGGGYLRHSPYWYTKMMIRLLNRQRLPAMVYMHPWELDPASPAAAGLGRWLIRGIGLPSS